MSVATTQLKSRLSANDSATVLSGYKRTEVGVIPDEWDVASLGAIAMIATGNTPPTHNSANYGDEYPFVSPIDIGETKYVANTAKRLSERGFSISRRFPEGSILFVSIGSTIGKCGIAPTELTSNQQINAVLPAPSFSIDYLYYAICSASSRIKALAGEQAVPIVNKTQFSETFIPLAPPAEQRAIAEALSDVDSLLGALEALIAKKQAIKQAAMQQLLTGKTRLPGFSGEWVTTTLGETADIRNGATPSTQITAFWNGSIPWCTPTDITGTPGKYLLTTERSITAEGLTSCAASLLPAGALLLCSRATIGEIKIAASPVCTNQGFKSLLCKDGVSNEFLYYLLVTLKPQMIKRAIGSTFLEIGKRDVAAIEVRLPPCNEQHAITSILCDIDAGIAALEQRRDKTRAIKQGMMQQLLTGRVRLVQPEMAAEQTAGP